MVISALNGGAGKTIISVGIIAALNRLGNRVRPYKKGPDYIDAGWLAMAAGRRCYNLDTFLVDPPTVLQSFIKRTEPDSIAIVEGNRGLFDGIDPQGSTSTAELSKLLKAPVILCLDCTKITRTTAAIVAGCQHFDPEVLLKGVILNRVAGPRHEAIIRTSIESHCGVPVLGALPKLRWDSFPERHMGLVPTPEHGWVTASIDAAADVAAKYLDLEPVAAIAERAGALEVNLQREGGHPPKMAPRDGTAARPPRIGVMRDSAFQFYYPENIDALKNAGGRVIFVSPLSQETLPAVDALYIGGGFPETHAKQLAENATFRRNLKRLAEEGLPIYAECGGLMYLGERMVLEGQDYPMVGVFPVVYGFSKRPQGHGYTIVSVRRQNPFFQPEQELRGHEFHYSTVLEWRGKDSDFVFEMKRGTGFIDGKDGICHKNVLATYTHIHSDGNPDWAAAIIRLARAYRRNLQNRS